MKCLRNACRLMASGKLGEGMNVHQSSQAAQTISSANSRVLQHAAVRSQVTKSTVSTMYQPNDSNTVLNKQVSRNNQQDATL